MAHISVLCCLVAVALAAPQGKYGGYSNRNSVVQGSALPMKFSVSKPPRESRMYLPLPPTGSPTQPQYQAGGTTQYEGKSSQYQGGPSQNQGGGTTQYVGKSIQYQGGASQYQGGTKQYQGNTSQYQGGVSQYQGGGTTQYQASSSLSQGGASQYQGGSTTYQPSAARPQYGVAGGNGNQYQNSGVRYGAEDPNAEPANYDFSYEVSAPEYDVQFGHQESRRDMAATGSYTVLLPDGRTQLVEYEADQDGYRPTVTYQEAAGGSLGSGNYGQGGYGGNGNAGTAGYGGNGNGITGGYGGNGNGGAGGYSGYVNAGTGYKGASKGGNGQSRNSYASKNGGAGKSSYSQKGSGYSGGQGQVSKY